MSAGAPCIRWGHLKDYFDQVCNSNFMLNPVCHALLVFMPVDSGMTPSSAGLPAPRRGLRADIPQYPGRS